MFVTQIISIAVFIISLLLSTINILASLFKNVGITCGISTWFFYLSGSLLPFVLAQMILQTAPDVFGIAYIFIVMNIFSVIIPYYMLTGALIFGQKYIYRITPFLTLKKYSYNDVIRYRMKYESGITLGRFGQQKVITYMCEIYFSDKHYSEFHVNKSNDKKVTYIKKVLQDNRCMKNKKINESEYRI